MLPVEPQVAPGEEHAESVPHDVVSPALILRLSDARVNEGISCLAGHVSLQMVLIVKPRHVDTNGVPLHFPVERVVGRHGVEEFSPYKLKV